MRFDNLADWLHWQEQHHPSAIDLGLARVKQVADRLGLTQPCAQRTVITVAGTNGKGSAVATLESLCLANDESVGAYTSPHLLHYNERIRVGGVPVDDGLICRAFAAIDAQAQDISLTYFEFGTLAALWIFNELQLRFWLLEVGLGGRLDAVNIIDADAALITSIALDHQDWLGTDLAAIGREKAGVFRPHQLAVYIDSRIENAVVDVANQLATDLSLVDRDFFLAQEQQRCVLTFGQHQLRFDLPQLPLPSVCAALVAAVKLALPIPTLWLAEVLPALSVAGRFQRVDYQDRQLLLDVAHNPAACTFFLQRVAQLRQLAQASADAVGVAAVKGKTHLVLAMMADKDIDAVLQLLGDEIGHWYFPELKGVGRAAPAELLANKLSAHKPGAAFSVHVDVAEALQAALRNSAGNDSIWVLGSFFTVAAALAWLAQAPTAAEIS
ncbi:bifunctional tetrahydrofolate synthase/dihydrofolate synthase [Simiduia curdlanivorans]|uniref:Dihydrofolate synthase/folylpolyglutamate synthase n=1 Tax=Simiduia curdlanivorans TaxID=1492769 RepID=A0ABV8V8G9_9GAMM|nr:bifunctional tetrahydrofolate synthase/dihydrofolate synthase [Simiduia curdlanivorans]MDN3639453.1 bifunctional tetrahydrofolate synthase/dihydrofolate synthase [Simiduia curdlanivorans]